MKTNQSLEIIISAINQNKDILFKGKKLKVLPKLSKLDYLNCLDTVPLDLEYFDYFGVSNLSVALYPTMRKIKHDYKITYKELSNLKWKNVNFAKDQLYIEF